MFLVNFVAVIIGPALRWGVDVQGVKKIADQVRQLHAREKARVSMREMELVS